MQIFKIGFSLNRNNYRTSPVNSNYNNKPTDNYNLLKQPVGDTVTFSGKIPSIVTPTMEDLINRTKAVDILRYNVLRLAKYDLPCPVCGRLMLDVDKFNEFENKVLSTTNPDEILNFIGELKKYLHPIEKKMYSIFREERYFHPDWSLYDILKYNLPSSEKKIVQTQSKIFGEIGILSRDLPPDTRKEVQNLINETFTRIFDTRETSRFSRRIFINKIKDIFIPEGVRQNLEEVFKNEYLKDKPNSKGAKTFEDIRAFIEEKMEYTISNWIYTPEQDKIIEKAVELPIARNNIDAFIVKYAKRDYKGANPDQKIALRMLSNSLATVEHIKPQFRKGATEPKNLAVECAADNNGRGSEHIIEQISENPSMLFNYPKYMGRLCKIHGMGKVEKSYITQQNKTFRDESFGILNADLSGLRQTKKKKLNKFKSDDLGITPTKNERRAARKLKLKIKSAKRKNNKI